MWKWKIIYDCNDEFGNPTCWSMETNSPVYGKYVWITTNSNNGFNIEVSYGTENFKLLFTSKSLPAAKRWVAINLL